MATNAVMEVIDRQHWLDRLGDTLQPAAAQALQKGGGQPLKDFLHGVWLGHPLHPVLTDVPIGSWTAALVLDALGDISGHDGFGRGADAAVAVGLVGAVGAALTGATDWAYLDGRARRLGLLHGLMNTGAVLLYTASWVMRRRRQRRAGRGFALLGYLASTAAAYLGGQLVYGERIGVDRAAAYSPPREFVPVLAEAELPEDELRRVEVDRLPLLLVRRRGQIYAMAETCSHLSGPLAEGRLEGSSIVCPWHGSRFSLEDGRVEHGPATHPQPCFETRIRGGYIEVRAARR
ncbi:MAG: Rieske 2Fe-2S domain-containing protein [Thermodesulfobacteriota bacterium]